MPRNENVVGLHRHARADFLGLARTHELDHVVTGAQSVNDPFER